MFHGAFLLVARDDQIAAWKAAANRAGLTLMAWAVDRLTTCARNEAA